MSDSLRNLFKEAGTLDNPNLTFTLTLELDKRLRIKDVSDCKFTSPIFKAEGFTISGDGHAVTVTCKLKADWRNHLEKLVKTPMVFTGTGVSVSDTHLQGAASFVRRSKTADRHRRRGRDEAALYHF